ncbi:MAG: hypothetical protein MK080_10440 [Opitutales bacterium]|nr:hypothetical protein [Opitutales bacterium]NRA28128.1 hypothetical protein [Opitutales bacterium]
MSTPPKKDVGSPITLLIEEPEPSAAKFLTSISRSHRHLTQAGKLLSHNPD